MRVTKPLLGHANVQEEDDMGFRINWDNGANDCGTFPYVFETKTAAMEFGENWVLEMTAATPGLDPEEEGYSYEMFEEKPTEDNPVDKSFVDWRDKAVTDEYDEK